jgi:hypothetical protein
MICDRCGEWVQPVIDYAQSVAICTACGYRNPRRFLPLFVVTGASGTGKTAIVPELRKLLPAWDVFETDVLRDSGEDWQFIKCNWLRITHSIHQSARPVVLCGSILPDQLRKCETWPFFPRIYWLALTCNAETQAARLRARPAFRGSTEAFIRDQQSFRQWFLDHSDTAFDPSLVVADTTSVPPASTAQEIRDWALSCQIGHSYNQE